MAVNVSVAQFRQADFIATVEQALTEARLPPRLLELEITESLIMDGAEHFIDKLGRLAKLGVLVSIDDFGTGYSSLSYLKRLPINRLKIDRSFVRDLHDDASDAGICRSIIAMAHGLGVQAVAEGVETQAQAAFLRGCGCDHLQGWLFSRALEAEPFAELLRIGAFSMLPPAEPK